MTQEIVQAFLLIFVAEMGYYIYTRLYDSFIFAVYITGNEYYKCNNVCWNDMGFS